MSFNKTLVSKQIGFSIPNNPGEHTAEMLIYAYRSHPDPIMTQVVCYDDGNITKQRLDGLRLNRLVLQDLLDVDGVDDVLIMIGVDHKYVDATSGQRTSNEENFTTILVGVDVNNNIIDTHAIDFCDPCPTACPANMAQLLPNYHHNCH